MTLSAIKSELQKATTIAFQLPNGELVAPHFRHRSRESNQTLYRLWRNYSKRRSC